MIDSCWLWRNLKVKNLNVFRSRKSELLYLFCTPGENPVNTETVKFLNSISQVFMKAMHFSTFNPLVFESVPELHLFTLGRKNAILQVKDFSLTPTTSTMSRMYFLPVVTCCFNLYLLNVVSENPLKDPHLIPAVTTLTAFISNPLWCTSSHTFLGTLFLQFQLVCSRVGCNWT